MFLSAKNDKAGHVCSWSTQTYSFLYSLNDQIIMEEEFKLLQAESQSDRIRIDVFKFIRLSVKSFPNLEGLGMLEIFKNACLAGKSEECVLMISAQNQWVRTVLDRGSLHSKPRIQTPSISDCIIQSNTLLYHPYWSQLEDEANTRVHFPSGMLEEAYSEREKGKSLKSILGEWRNKGQNCRCTIGMHKRVDLSTPVTRDWEINYADESGAEMKRKKDIYYEKVWLVEWRGGLFVQKETGQDSGEEFKVVKRVRSHPNIVYGFCELVCDEAGGRAYFMEYMSNDLFSLIVDKRRGDDNPPFSPLEALDMLLQFAKAMKHMHQEGVNTVHCDLKSKNVLISLIGTSEIAISDNAKVTSHYLVKVADFGNAQYWVPCPEFTSDEGIVRYFWNGFSFICVKIKNMIKKYWGESSAEPAIFKAGGGTTHYAAPEVLQQRKDRTFRICYPEKIDVYSFGIVAFEVITGQLVEEYFKFLMGVSHFKAGVIEGTVRPPLRKECGKSKEFMQDDELLGVIESCWHPNPAERPSFVKICEDLNNGKVRILEEITQRDPSSSQIGSVGVHPSPPKVAFKGTRESRWREKVTTSSVTILLVLILAVTLSYFRF